ncbi:PREDICTED: cyclin-dependent kinase 12-like [Thamnophis sirtalis]|uniref:Cyclin-dependent kinase 12-like n=1 Tax=Thamnophis sirtalis TaxID=35019 RepID=A0A6I9YWD8_9SAUR|nr:PREDICTED: cyclin-dependent kinase 12-like [Thamnophis sirtalis]
MTAALLQLLSQQETALLSHPKQEPQVARASLEYTRSQTSSRTYTTTGPESCNFDVDEGNFNQTVTETSSSPMGKSRTFLSFTSHIRESSSYQSAESIQFPGDQDLRFTRVPLGIHSVVGQSFIKIEGSNNTLVHSEAKIHNNNEVGVTKAHLSNTGGGHLVG